MKNSFYLLEKNKNNLIKQPQIIMDACYIKINSEIDFSNLTTILNQLAIAIKTQKVKTIIIVANEMKFDDKLIYILFECTIYSLITKYKKRIYMQCDESKLSSHIFIAGIKESLIYRMARGEIKSDEFEAEFKKNIIGKNHFRKIISKETSSSYFSKLMGDIKSFLCNSFVYNKRNNVERDKFYIDEVANVIIELVQNANEHSNSDCLIDIDLSGDWYRPKNKERKFLTINLIVLNFSKILLGDTVKKKILNSQNLTKDRYRKANDIYKYQKEYFGDLFNENIYFDVMTFQNGISGRANTVTGGTGLPLLLKFLMAESETEYCYMLSGRYGLNLQAKKLEISDEWVGFNENNNILDLPDEEFLIKNKLFLPGCAFNLNLTIEQEAI